MAKDDKKDVILAQIKGIVDNILKDTPEYTASITITKKAKNTPSEQGREKEG